MNSPDGLLALLIVLSAWALMAWLFIGVGLLVLLVLGLPMPAAWAWRRSFWLGVAATIAWLQTWHLWLPVDDRALLMATGLALAGWLAWCRGRGASDAGATTTQRHLADPPHPPPASRTPILLAALAVLYLAHRATGPCDHWDTGLYHAPAICWARQHAIVPGLANLHWRLAFNNAHFLIGAMIETGPWRQGAPHVLTGALVAALTVQAVLGCGALMRHTGAPRPRHLACLILLLAIAGVLHSSPFMAEIASPSPDAFVACMALAAGLMAFDFFAGDDGHAPSAIGAAPAPSAWSDDARAQALTCVAVACAGVCVKVSLAAFALPLSILIGVVAWRRSRRAGAPARRQVATLVLAAGLLVAPWAGRNVVLSGYPLFPLEWGRAPVPWALALGEGVGRTEVMAWARTPPAERAAGRQRDADVLRDYAWLPGWWRRAQGTRPQFIYPAALALIGGLLLLAARGAQGRWPAQAWGALGVVVPAATAVLVWFFTAPDPRFICGPIWVLAIVSLACGIVAWPALLGGVVPRAIAVVAVVLVTLRLPYTALLAYARAGSNPLPLLYRHLVLEPGSDRGLHPPPSPPLQTVVTHSGLGIHTNPQTGQCWYGPLPSAPYADPRLRLRREGDLGSGFLIDSPAARGPAKSATSPAPSSTMP